ncbi:hypothetical protein [Geobacter sp. SVR]|uniref:hypothetical protein n=1 Tax=Geobacter sp. SVR TaxID=2495594 RepID=UPI00143EF4D3|nr:hypothetical protein [Geobacter sp. SVR]BCS54660.1 hypothetical protein GSVR_29680 [Geobacter sp. SVR]GCF87600.1 hypothetical protein GSbR_42000 [Geobacter sp. SVR]
MTTLFKYLALVLQAAVFSALLSNEASAMEQLNMKNITDADKVYFGKRLTKEQLEKLQYILANGFTTSKSPCEKVAAINKNLLFLKTVTSVFREASASGEISTYARSYSSSLTHEFTATAKVFGDILPRYEQACRASRHIVENTEQRVIGKESSSSTALQETARNLDHEKSP